MAKHSKTYRKPPFCAQKKQTNANLVGRLKARAHDRLTSEKFGERSNKSTVLDTCTSTLQLPVFSGGFKNVLNIKTPPPLELSGGL